MQQPDADEIQGHLPADEPGGDRPGGTSLFAAIGLAGIAIESICGGKGTCGKCRVILTTGTCTACTGVRDRLPAHAEGAGRGVLSRLPGGTFNRCRVHHPGGEPDRFPPDPRHAARGPVGYCRAVCHAVPGGTLALRRPAFCLAVVRFTGYTGLRPRITDEQYHALLASETPLAAILSTLRAPPTVLSISPADSPAPMYGVAIDLGTTTVVGCLARLDTGEILATGSALNRQITYGEELLTRIGYSASPAGVATLQKAAATSINDVIETLALNRRYRTDCNYRSLPRGKYGDEPPALRPRPALPRACGRPGLPGAAHQDRTGDRHCGSPRGRGLLPSQCQQVRGRRRGRRHDHCRDERLR